VMGKANYSGYLVVMMVLVGEIEKSEENCQSEYMHFVLLAY